MAQLQRVAIASEQIQGQQILLTSEQLHYLVRVLRLKSGDRFIAIDPHGGWWRSVLQEESGEILGQILESMTVATELPATMTLMAAMPKGSGFEEIVRQVTELGVSAIYPVISDRTLLKPSPQKIQRWRRIAQEAAEQSEREYVPTIFDPISFSDSPLIKGGWGGSNPSEPTDSPLTKGGWGGFTQKYICVARGDAPHLLDTLTAHSIKSTQKPEIFIATGPEGGWTPAEIEEATAAGVHPVSLGKRILRSITAPVVALSLVAAYLEKT
jgi:16S rRNA (uracil1498-N3)-methyltransferase